MIQEMNSDLRGEMFTGFAQKPNAQESKLANVLVKDSVFELKDNEKKRKGGSNNETG